jgi:Flp pilus assembly protein TadD
MKDYKAAAGDWKTAQKLAPQNVYYPWQIARACSKLEDFTSAEYYYLAALKLKPQEQRLRQELEAVRKQQTASSEHRRSAP